MNKNAMKLLRVLVGIVVLAIMAVILFPTGHRGRNSARRSSCASNLRQIGLVYAYYRQDYDDKFPLTSRPEGWHGLLQPYVDEKWPSYFDCPSEELRGDDNLTDYWFNRRLAGVEQENIAEPAYTLLSGDGEPSDDPNVSLQLLPPLWITREDSPAQRHLGGANYLFADGHVKSLKPNVIGGKEAPTFLLR